MTTTVFNDGSKELARATDCQREQWEARIAWEAVYDRLLEAINDTSHIHGARFRFAKEIALADSTWWVVTINRGGQVHELTAISEAYVRMATNKLLRAYLLWLICPPAGMDKFDTMAMFKLLGGAK